MIVPADSVPSDLMVVDLGPESRETGKMKGHPDDHLAAQFGSMSDVDKIEWMIETNGWALEPVAPVYDADPPTPAYAYTIGVPELTGFAEVADGMVFVPALVEGTRWTVSVDADHAGGAGHIAPCG